MKNGNKIATMCGINSHVSEFTAVTNVMWKEVHKFPAAVGKFVFKNQPYQPWTCLLTLKQNNINCIYLAKKECPNNSSAVALFVGSGSKQLKQRRIANC